jgi:hypothetical protein
MMGYRAGKDNFDDMHERERLRVAALIVAEQQWREGEQFAIANVDGRPRLLKATDVIAARRAAASNGMGESETTDTIGKLWAHDFLVSGRFESDLLRDAGRRYAAAYWWRYGPVCGRTGAYSDMRGSGWISTTVIVDESADLIAEQRFRARDDAVRTSGLFTKFAVDQVCVDGQGDNDPLWLIDLINGYSTLTEKVRVTIARKKASLTLGTKHDRRLAKRRLDSSRAELTRILKEARAASVPHRTVKMIVCGLEALATVDKGEGLHKPRRGEKISGVE